MKTFGNKWQQNWTLRISDNSCDWSSSAGTPINGIVLMLVLPVLGCNVKIVIELVGGRIEKKSWSVSLRYQKWQKLSCFTFLPIQSVQLHIDTELEFSFLVMAFVFTFRFIVNLHKASPYFWCTLTQMRIEIQLWVVIVLVDGKMKGLYVHIVKTLTCIIKSGIVYYNSADNYFLSTSLLNLSIVRIM